MNHLARVARATNQAEAEFVQALLFEAGIPSMLRRSPGFDLPDMLAARPALSRPSRTRPHRTSGRSATRRVRVDAVHRHHVGVR